MIRPQSRLIDPTRKGARVLPARNAAVVPLTPDFMLSEIETTVLIAEPGFVCGGMVMTEVVPFGTVELEIEDLS